MKEHPLGQWFKAKKEAGERLPQRDLAKQVGCAPSRLSQIINDCGTPSLALASRLSKATGIPLDKFVKQDEAAQ